MQYSVYYLDWKICQDKMQLSSSCVFEIQHPIFRAALNGGAHSSRRNSGHANCRLASRGPNSEYFHRQSQSRQGVTHRLRPSLSGFPKVFLVHSYQTTVLPCACICVSLSTFSSASASTSRQLFKIIPLFTGSNRVFDKSFWAKSISVARFHLFAVRSLGHEIQRGCAESPCVEV